MSSVKSPSPKKRENQEKKDRSRRKGTASEKRKHPRFLMELPLDYSRKGRKTDFGGIVKNASESGILVYLPEKINVGETLKVEIYYAKGLELNTLKGIAKIVRADLAARGSWKTHQYGLEFHSMPKGTIQKLRNLLKDIGNIHNP